MASPERQYRQLGHWQEVLALSSWNILLERISPFQVTNEDGKANNSLVGIRPDGNEEKRAILFHTRKLYSKDIVHELLHIAHPDWSHEQVENETHQLTMESG